MTAPAAPPADTTPPATDTTPAADTAPAAATPAKTKSTPNPIKSIERMIAKAIKLIEEGSGTPEEKASFAVAWKGYGLLLQTIGENADPENPPAEGSAWDAVRKLVASKAKVERMFVPGPRDAF
jgi:hypothetical protein